MTTVGLVATTAAVWKAVMRTWDLYQDWNYVKAAAQGGDGELRLELLMTKNLFRAQFVRAVAYVSILILFVLPFTTEPGNVQRFARTVLVLVVLVFFAAEEFYLDRARDRWLSDIRKARDRDKL